MGINYRVCPTPGLPTGGATLGRVPWARLVVTPKRQGRPRCTALWSGPPAHARWLTLACEVASGGRTLLVLMVFLMVIVMKSKPTEKPLGLALSDSVKDSAQLIWQAGLGAFHNAQLEGSKAFEALVKEGVRFQRKTQLAAQEKMAEANHTVTDMAQGMSAQASGQWDKLGAIFEDRVAKALHRLGVPARHDLDALAARVDALSLRVQAPPAPTRPAPVVAKKLAPRRSQTTARPSTQAAAKPAPKPAPKPASKPASKPATKPAAQVAPPAAAKRTAPRQRARAAAPAKAS